jgi:hypothetical protein
VLLRNIVSSLVFKVGYRYISMGRRKMFHRAYFHM